MATYLPNIKDYIPEVTAYTPDFKFLSDALDSRQDRYDKTTQQLNNLYGQVVYADLSRADNQSVRDDYSKLLAPKIQQISGVDFSLAQNVQAAKGLFKPFYEDEKIVRDIVFTKSYKDQMKIAENLRKSTSADVRDKYWDDGVQYMNFQMEDFKNNSRDESMNVRLPEYVEDPDVYERSLEALYTGGPEGKGIKAKETFVDATGQFIVTQENGVTLTSKPTGRIIDNPLFDETKPVSQSNPQQVPEMYNPAGERIRQTVLDDPLVQQGLMVKAYVAARNEYDAKAKESGQSADVFKREWANRQIAEYNEKSGIALKIEKEELQKTSRTLTSFDKYIEEAPLIKDSDEYLAYYEAMVRGETIENGIKELEKRQKDILKDVPEEDVEELLNRGYAAYISNGIGRTIMDAARQYSDETSSRTFVESKIYIEKLRHRNNLQRDAIKRQNELNDELNKKLLAINQASTVPTAIPGDSRENTKIKGTIIERNEKGELSIYNKQNVEKIKGIVAFYTYMANDLNTDINLQNMADLRLTEENSNSGEISTAGIYIPNKKSNVLQFYRWEDAVPMLLENPDIIDYHYNIAEHINNNQDEAISYKMEDKTELRAIMNNLFFNVNRTNTRLQIIKDKQNEVYQNVIADLDLSNIRAGLGQENLEDWKIDLFDADGHMITTTQLYNTKINEVTESLREQIPQYLPSKQEIFDTWSDGNNNWITTDDDPNSPITPQALRQRTREAGAHVGPYMAAYFGLVEDNPLGMDGQKFMNIYYSNQNKPWVQIPIDQKVPLVVKPGSTIENVYGDIANDYLEFGSFKQVIDAVKGEMNSVMESDTAINGKTTFDFNSMFYGDGSVGDAAIVPVIPFRYDAGSQDIYTNNFLDYFYKAFDGLPSPSILSMTGDRGASFSSEINADDQKIADMVLNQIRADRNYIPGSTSKASDPGYRIEYSSVGGGETAEGKWAMVKYILDADYAETIVKNLPLNTEKKKFLTDNTITVFLNKDLFSSQYDPDQQVSSTVKTMIKMPENQGRATISIENGGIVHFEMNQGMVTQRYAQYTFFDNGPNKGNMVLGTFSAPQPLVDNAGNPITDLNVDLFYEAQKDKLQELANTNLTAQKTFKLTQQKNP